MKFTGQTLDFSAGGKPTGLPTPTGPTDGVPKSYADALAQGVAFKQAVRLATAAALPANVASGSGAGKTLTASGNGALSVDGVAAVVGDRILVKNEVAGANDGIYTVTATGDAGATYALTRATDADGHNATSGLANGASVYVDEGTNQKSVWTLITEGAITIDTTAQSWSQTNGTADITAGTGITITGATISLPTVAIALGGTGSTTAAGARANLAATTKFAQDVGDNATQTFSINHALGTADISSVTVIDKATGNAEIVDWAVVDSNHVSVGPFVTAPAASGGSIPSGTGKRVIVTA